MKVWFADEVRWGETKTVKQSIVVMWMHIELLFLKTYIGQLKL